MIGTVVLLVLLFVLLVVDWLQTLEIAVHPERWHETNPILGVHPSPLSVHLWFAVCLWALMIAALVLPVNYLQPIAALWCVAEGACVLNNWQLGIRL